MQKINDPITEDFSDFGRREIEIAKNLLDAYLNRNKTHFLGDGIKVVFNRNSGYVFISDSDYNTAMLNGKNQLIDFLSCPECGNEGLISDKDVFRINSKKDVICQQCHKTHWSI